MSKLFDCVLCGSCVVDVLVRPFPLDTPIKSGSLIHVDPLEMTTGGLVSNAGIAMSRLGMKVAAFSYVGRDDWAGVIRRKYTQEGVNIDRLLIHPEEGSSTTAVLVDPGGERCIVHCVGAPRRLDKQVFFENLDLFAQSRMTLIGYYSLMPGLERDLPSILAAIRETGCQTAMDAAGDGGAMEPLDRILPHLDIYVPSLLEATHQTGEKEPKKIIEAYRACGAPGLLGVKLGSKGILLSPRVGELLEIDCIEAPSRVLDTTGAGDSFYAGLIAGLLRGMSLQQAGRLGAAAGAYCVTGVGATAGLVSFEQTANLAGLGIQRGQ